MKKYFIVVTSFSILIFLAAQSSFAKSAYGEGNAVKDANNLLRQAQNTINNSSKAAVREQEQIIKLKQKITSLVDFMLSLESKQKIMIIIFLLKLLSLIK